MNDAFAGARTICILAAGPLSDVPLSIVKLAEELCRHHERVAVTYSNDVDVDVNVDVLHECGVIPIRVENWCYDFGQWFTVLSRLYEDFSLITLINDSCILIKKMDQYMKWGLSAGFDCWGLTSSLEVEFHVQSYIRTYTGIGVRSLMSFVHSDEVYEHLDKISILPLTKLRKEIIKTYEIEMLSRIGISSGAIFNATNNSSWHNWHLYMDDPRFCLLKKKRAHCPVDVLRCCDSELSEMVSDELLLWPGLGRFRKRLCRRAARMKLLKLVNFVNFGTRKLARQFSKK